MSHESQKTAVVTGATGCVGYHIVLLLLKQNWNVIVLHRSSSDVSMFLGKHVTLREVDFFSKESLENAIGTRVDCIFHSAASLAHHPDAMQEKINVTTTKLLATIALTRKVRFIFSSTGATHPYRNNFDEQEIRRIRNGYVRTKRLAELEIIKLETEGLDDVRLQPDIVIGPYDFHNNYSSIFLKKDLTFSLPGKIDFCDVRQVAQAHVQAYHTGKKGISYQLSGVYMSWFDFFKQIARVTHARPPRIVVPKIILKCVGYVELALFYLAKRHPELTPELVELIGGATRTSDEAALEAEKDLGYLRNHIDVPALCKEVYEWTLNDFRKKQQA